MSWEALAWARAQRTGSPTRKAVLMAFAYRHNGDTGRCDPHLGCVAEDTELNVRTVERAAKDLCDAGLLTRKRRRRRDGSLAGYRYRFPHVPERASQPPDTESGSPPDTESGQELEVGLELEVRSVEEKNKPSSTSLTANGPTSVDRKRVTPAELGIAVGILGIWNQATGQQLRSNDWLSKIILRVREYPEATLADHALIIETALADPWWKGAVSPSVIYGSGAQFERAVEAVRAPGPERMTDLERDYQDFLQRGGKW